MSLNNKNNDGNSNKEIDALFCIIDDNEYYNYNLLKFKKEIIINEVYFIYIKGNKNINLYDAIEKYLNLLNKNIINKITLGSGFFERYENIDDIPIFEMIDYALINKKNFSVKSSTLINFNIREDYYYNVFTKQKIYLGIYFLFEKGKIDGSIILDFKTYKYNNNLFKAKEEIKGKFLLIKIYDYDNLSDEKFIKISNDLINCDINFVICYVCSKGKEKNCNVNNEVKLPFYFKTPKEFLLYPEIPLKINYEINKENIYRYYYYEVFDCQNNLILYFQNSGSIDGSNIFNYYFFLLEKYDKFCFKIYKYSENSDYFKYKLYFIKKKNINKTYDIIVCTNDKNENFHIGNIFLRGCVCERSGIKFETIEYKELSFDWKNISTPNKNKKGKKGHKMNEKQIIDNELEEQCEEYINDYEEDN